MKNYRSAFILALVVNVALAGVAIGLWWHSRSARATVTAGETPGTATTQTAASESGVSTVETPLTPVQISPQRLQSIGVTTGEVQRKEVVDEIRTTGNVAIDETRLAYVQTRFAGWIQKVFVDATYKYVRKGQPLFTIYSPDLVNTERDYLVAKDNQRKVAGSTVGGVSSGAATLVDAASERLTQFGVPQSELARLESSGDARREVEIDSPASGYVIDRKALPNMYVQPDTQLYTVADLSTVWVFAQVFQNDLGRIKIGDPVAVSVDSYTGRTFRGRVDFIYPDVDMSTRTARVRLILPNPGLKLAPGMFVNATLKVPMGRQLTIPASGVLHSGTRSIVFVDHGQGYLEPREVELGARVNDEFVVTKGVSVGDRITTSANFLVDSESQLQAALGSFVPPPPGAGTTSAATPAAEAKVEFTTDPSPPHRGSNVFRVKLTDAQGATIGGAEVTVVFFMPAMPDMGMAALTVTSKLGDKGNGNYEGTGTLQSGGTWQVTITARKGGQTLATKRSSMHAEGGM